MSEQYITCLSNVNLHLGSLSIRMDPGTANFIGHWSFGISYSSLKLCISTRCIIFNSLSTWQLSHIFSSHLSSCNQFFELFLLIPFLSPRTDHYWFNLSRSLSHCDSNWSIGMGQLFSHYPFLIHFQQFFPEAHSYFFNPYKVPSSDNVSSSL